MKIFKLALILLIGMISCMGFATAHSDPAENSISKETQSMQIDSSFDGVNVVIFTVLNLETFTSLEITTTKISAKSFIVLSILAQSTQKIRLVNDVGWHNLKDTYNFTKYQEHRANYNIPINAYKYTFIDRRARDGLSS